MARYRITYWRQIPSMVTAQAGDGSVAKVQLPQRFQELIDEEAMRLGMAGSGDYLEQWRQDEWQDAEGTPDEVATAVAARIEEEWKP